MISIIHYISSKRRLQESTKTIYMMGGREECQPMLLAQHDMIEHEVEYYKEEMAKFLVWGFLFASGCAIITYIYFLLKP